MFGQSSFLPIQFDREYTCLTMTTIHASLIDYRFRMLPMLQMPQNNPPKSKKKIIGTEEYEDLEMKHLFDEEDSTFT
jgi:hypothetical protein